MSYVPCVFRLIVWKRKGLCNEVVPPRNAA